MAAYNGEKYIEEQITTIIAALGDDDELVVSCDPSNDRTNEIIYKYCLNDERIRLFENTGEHGVVPNFCNALSLCRGKYIFLCDQDDIWQKNKVEEVVQRFEQNQAWLVIHDADLVDSNGNSLGDTLFRYSNISTNPVRNYYKGTYWGCCMAFRAELCPIILPINSELRHDLWIGILVGLLKKKIVLIDEPLISHRLHENNVTTGHRRLMKEIISDRYLLACELFKRIRFAKKTTIYL